MRRFVVPAAISAIAVILLIVLAVGISGQGSNNSIAYSVDHHAYKVAPKQDETLPVLANTTVARSIKSYRGKLVLVNFFASWCEPCQAEAPILAKAEKMLQAYGGTVIGVAFQNGPAEARSYLKSYGLDYPAFTDPDGNLAGAWGITQVPDSYLIDREGKIVWLTYEVTSAFDTKTLPQLIAKYA